MKYVSSDLEGGHLLNSTKRFNVEVAFIQGLREYLFDSVALQTVLVGHSKDVG
jgi:hypothetical protein